MDGCQPAWPTASTPPPFLLELSPLLSSRSFLQIILRPFNLPLLHLFFLLLPIFEKAGPAGLPPPITLLLAFAVFFLTHMDGDPRAHYFARNYHSVDVCRQLGCSAGYHRNLQQRQKIGSEKSFPLPSPPPTNLQQLLPSSPFFWPQFFVAISPHPLPCVSHITYNPVRFPHSLTRTKKTTFSHFFRESNLGCWERRRRQKKGSSRSISSASRPTLIPRYFLRVFFVLALVPAALVPTISSTSTYTSSHWR